MNAGLAVALSEMVCGEPDASSAISKFAARIPGAIGLKATEIAQLAEGATGAVQLLLVMLKSEELGPLRETEETCSGAVPELMTMSVWAIPDVPWVIVGKDGAAGEKEIAGVGATPVPFSVEVCGLPGALSATCTVAENVPGPDGIKLMLTVQLALGASVDAQVLDSGKLEAFGPVMEMELMERF